MPLQKEVDLEKAVAAASRVFRDVCSEEPPYHTAEELWEALKQGDEGARLLFVFFLRLRKNERTRCSVEKAIAAEGKRWVGVLMKGSWRLYLLMCHRAVPYQGKPKSVVAVEGSRAQRRILARSGLARYNAPSLKEKAAVRLQTTWNLWSHPILYGFWHAYKFCVTQPFRTLWPIVTFFRKGLLRSGDTVPCYPRLITMEITVGALLLGMGPHIRRLNRKCHSLGLARPVNRRGRLRCAVCKAIQVLLTQYCPMLLYLGHLVRQCNWAGETANTGVFASEGLQIVMCLLDRLNMGDTLLKYEHTVATAPLCHTAWHTAMPGQASAEEFHESLLSSLVTKKGQDIGAVTIEDVDDLYHLITIRKEGHRVNVCKIPNSFVNSVRQRLTAYLNAERVYVPWVRWCAEPTCTIQAHWPRRGVPNFPPSLLIPKGSNHYKQVLVSVLLVLTQQGPP